jgi:small GTP-binding protein
MDPSTQASFAPPTDPYDILARVLIVGNSTVGKTCLAKNYRNFKFVDTCISTIGIDFYTKIQKSGDTLVKLQIWDTAGQEKFRAITKAYYRGAAAVILVYSIDDRKSFIDVENWLSQIQEQAHDDILILLVANKLDLASARVVEKDEGIKLYESKRLSYFCETSAKTGEHIRELFETLAEKVKLLFLAGSSKVSNRIIFMDKDKKTLSKQKTGDSRGCRCS